jgi:hypothetical protein
LAKAGNKVKNGEGSHAGEKGEEAKKREKLENWRRWGDCAPKAVFLCLASFLKRMRKDVIARNETIKLIKKITIWINKPCGLFSKVK